MNQQYNFDRREMQLQQLHVMNTHDLLAFVTVNENSFDSQITGRFIYRIEEMDER